MHQKKIFNLMKQRIQNQSGFSHLEIIIGTLIIVAIIMTAIDLSAIAASHSSISSLANYTARTIAEQGSLAPSAPSKYVGNYTNTSEVLTFIEDSLRQVGIPRDDWQLLIDGVEFTAASATPDYPYKTMIDVELRYTQNFNLINQVIPGSLPVVNRNAHRRVLSTYYHRNSSNPNSGDIVIQ